LYEDDDIGEHVAEYLHTPDQTGEYKVQGADNKLGQFLSQDI